MKISYATALQNLTVLIVEFLQYSEKKLSFLQKMPEQFNNHVEKLVRVNSETAYKLKANIKTLNEEKICISEGQAIHRTDLWRAIN